MTTAAAFTAPATIVAYALAGRAILTLQSEKTGAHYTFKVSHKKDSRSTFFVSIREQGGDFAYLGLLEADEYQASNIRHTARSVRGETDPAFRGFRFLWSHVARGVMPPSMVVRHEGTCGHCGRELTHPELIESGIGPVCAKKAA